MLKITRRTACCLLVSIAGLAFAVSLAQAVIIYVDDDARPGGDGLTWNAAYTHLQDALAFAAVAGNNVTEIRIGQGLYLPDRDEKHPAGTGDRAASFFLSEGLTLAGGFAGFGAADPDERDIDRHETILSGDLAGNDLPGLVNRSDNSRHVLQFINKNFAALDGLTVSGGHADDTEPTSDSVGGGLFIKTDDNNNAQTICAITQCTFRGNFAQLFAGALYARNAAFLEIDHCIFKDNDGRGSCLGTALTDETSISFSTFSDNTGTAVATGKNPLTVSDCVFERNTAGSGQTGALDCNNAQIHRCTFRNNSGTGGGALEIDDGDIVDCIFDSNTAEYGGAVYMEGSGADFFNCTFTNNSATDEGGAIAMLGASPSFQDCTFDLNSAVEGGGAMYIGTYVDDDYVNGSSPIITDCLFTRCTSATGGALETVASEPWLVNCRFESNAATLRGGAMANFGVPSGYNTSARAGRPRLHNCVFWDNQAPKGGAMYSHFSFVKLVNCTLVSNQATLGGAVLSHSSAALRMYNSIVRSNGAGQFSGAGERTVRYCNIQGGHDGTGNIDINPKFRNAEIGDLRIKAGSRCIDAGRNAYLPGNVLLDIAGNLRFHDDPATPNTGIGSPAVVDIGAYEF